MQNATNQVFLCALLCDLGLFLIHTILLGKNQ